jgi:hypothetical protein
MVRSFRASIVTRDSSRAAEANSPEIFYTKANNL